MSDNSKLWDNIIFLMTWSWWPNVSVKLQRWLSSANWQGYVLNGRRLDWFSGGGVWGARRRYLYFLASNGPTKIRMVEFFEVLAYFKVLFKSAVWFTTDSERGEMGARSVEELPTTEGFSGMKRHGDAIKNGIRNVGRFNGHSSAWIGKVRIFP